MSKKGGVQTWAYEEASSTTGHVRTALGELREKYIATWHFFHLRDYNHKKQKFKKEMTQASESGKIIIQNLEANGIYVYQTPLRGIALYPFVVFYRSNTQTEGLTPREAFWVYKDTRHTISSFVFKDVLMAYNDLYGWELPIPDKWKLPGAKPTIITD